ncbi:MAG: ABC transporter substrate-binding protein [Eubacteriales bacterium]
MKKIFVYFIISILTLSMLTIGCSSNSTTQTSKEETVRIGIIQLVEHPSLDYIRTGVLKAIKDNGYVEGKNLELDYQNAQGDQSTLNTIANKFAGENLDVIIAITTPATQAAAAATSSVPIIFGAVTDPVAANLVKSLENPGTNVSGVSDLNPFEAQFEMIQKIVPDAKKLGIIFNTSEVNSQVQVDKAKEIGGTLGYEIITAPINTSNEVLQAAQSLVGKIDAFYVITDNTVATSINSLSEIARENKIPAIVAEDSQVEGGCLCSIGIDYETLGYQTGEMAVRVLKGANPSEMPVEYQTKLKVVINSETQDILGITIPEEYTKNATYVK